MTIQKPESLDSNKNLHEVSHPHFIPTIPARPNPRSQSILGLGPLRGRLACPAGPLPPVKPPGDST